MHHRRTGFFLLLAAMSASCQIVSTEEAIPAASSSDIQFLAPEGPWPFPFSEAVRAGDFIFVSGQLGTTMVDGAPVLVTGGIEEETHQTMRNIRDILTRHGSSLERVVKCLVMIDDMAEWPRMNAVYATYFPGSKPARSALGADGLALNAKVEIECTALAR